MSDVTCANGIYEVDTVRVTLQFSITNERGTPSVEVSPPPVSLGYPETTTSITFSTNVTLSYGTNYTFSIAASNFAGTEKYQTHFFAPRGMIGWLVLCALG